MTIKRVKDQQAEMLQGTLDMLVLQSLLFGAAHGYTIARLIQQRSDDVLKIGQGSLYPALQRLEDRKWIASYWGTSENNRKARFYKLTAQGRRQLDAETDTWKQVVQAITRAMRPVDDAS